MITFSRVLTVKRQNASLSEPIYLYKGDGDITLILDLINISKNFTRKNIINDEIVRGTICIYKPDGILAFASKAEIIEKQIHTVLNKEMMDENVEIGEHTLQIHLYDADDNRLTLPEVKQIFIAKPLCDNNHSEPDIVRAQVGNSKVGYSIVG